MCHSEFSQGTEYGCRIAVTPLHRRAESRGSTCLIEVSTLRRVTIYPFACSCPILEVPHQCLENHYVSVLQFPTVDGH